MSTDLSTLRLAIFYTSIHFLALIVILYVVGPMTQQAVQINLIPRVVTDVSVIHIIHVYIKKGI